MDAIVEWWTSWGGTMEEAGVQLVVALICGILLGLERERKDKPAGLRTIVLITVGSTLYMIVSRLIPVFAGWPESITRVNPARIAAQVVTGVGFLGAVTIIQARGAVHGLTTAAVIWVAAAVGLCVGIGFPLLGLAVSFGVLVALIAMDPLRRWVSRRGAPQRIELLVLNDRLILRRIEQVLDQYDVPPSEIETQPRGDGEMYVTATHHIISSSATSRLLAALAQIDGVRGVPHFEEAGEERQEGKAC